MTASVSAGLTVRPVSAADWDDFVRAQPNGHLLQLTRWGELKSQFGWEYRIIALADEQGIQAGALALLQRLPIGAGRLAYAPMGGYATDSFLYPQLWRTIRRETGAAFLKLEPGLGAGLDAGELLDSGFQRSPQSI